MVPSSSIPVIVALIDSNVVAFKFCHKPAPPPPPALTRFPLTNTPGPEASYPNAQYVEPEPSANIKGSFDVVYALFPNATCQGALVLQS